MLSKKYYKEIARIIFVNKYKPAYVDKIENLSRDLALYFKRDNPKFNEEKFLNAWGVLK